MTDTCIDICTHMMIFGQPTPCFLVLQYFSLPLFCTTQALFFTYLEILLLLFVVRIPIHSCPWFAINCPPLAVSPFPMHPTDQVTYLHRRNQQHQPSHLIQFLFLGVIGIAALYVRWVTAVLFSFLMISFKFWLSCVWEQVYSYSYFAHDRKSWFIVC